MTTEPTLAADYALLWGQSQGAIHIEPIAEMLDQNRQACAVDRRMDYVPIAIGSQARCYEIAEQVRKTLAERRARQSNPQ